MGRVPLCGDTEHGVLATGRGWKEHLFEFSGRMLHFFSGFGLCLVKGVGATLLTFCLLFFILFSPQQPFDKGKAKLVLFQLCYCHVFPQEQGAKEVRIGHVDIICCVLKFCPNNT